MRCRSRVELVEANADLASLIENLPGFDPWALAPEGSYFDVEGATWALAWYPRYIRHAKGTLAGKPFELMPWLQAVTALIFGFKREDESRRFREVFIYVPKKNSKTSYTAGLMLFVLATDDEYGAELYSAAASREQAALLFQHAAGMVELEDELRGRLEVYGAKRGTIGGSQVRSITYPDQMSSYRCLAADANTADGANVHLAVIDEVHRHKSPELADVLQKSTASRRQPLVIYTTTADYARESLCNRLLARAKAVRDNPGDPDQLGYDSAFLPVIYEADAKDDWRDPATWAKANPSLGASVPEEFLRRECQKASETPSELNSFLRLHLNIVTDADEAWLDMTLWDACVGTPIEPSKLEEWIERMGLLAQPCYAALDLSKTTDLTGLVLWFPKQRVVLPFAWIPRATAHKAEDRDRVPYSTWARHGFLEMTEGNVVDYEHVFQRVMQEVARFDIRWFGYDPWNATQMALKLQAEGVPVEEFRQGYASMSEPSKEVERKILSGELVHGGHPVLRWCAQNTMVRRDPAGNIKPDKQKSTGRIDLLVGLVMAMGGAIVGAPEPKQSLNDLYAQNPDPLYA